MTQNKQTKNSIKHRKQDFTNVCSCGTIMIYDKSNWICPKKLEEDKQTCKCGHLIDLHIESILGKCIAGECSQCDCKKYSPNKSEGMVPLKKSKLPQQAQTGSDNSQHKSKDKENLSSTHDGTSDCADPIFGNSIDKLSKEIEEAKKEWESDRFSDYKKDKLHLLQAQLTTELRLSQQVRNILDMLIKDYGYCNCKRSHKDIHMDIVADLEKAKKEMSKL